jgi:hypothetical protein
MPDDTTKHDTQDTDHAADDLESKIDTLVTQRLNSAITGHIKRLKVPDTASIEKAVSDAVAKALAAAAPARQADTTAPGQAAQGQAVAATQGAADVRPDPKIKLLEEQIEKLRQERQQDQERVRATEEKARKDAARATLREALEAKGIKGARARAVISDFELSGALRFTDEGKPELVVARSRAKGADPEEIAWDLRRGVEDWVKGEDAKDFLPPPSAPTGPGARGVPLSGTIRRGVTPPTDLPENASLETLIDRAVAAGVGVPR